ncbi:MAG: ornithine cyclodeaminase family protein [Microbacterium sp.]
MTSSIEHIDAAAVERLLTRDQAVEALREALIGGYRPESDHARVIDPLDNGELLLMPSEAASDVGLKVLTLSPANPERGLPRIQGVYLLFDRETLAPTCLIDGPALTGLRTAAVSIAAVKDALVEPSPPLDVVVYGAGPQADAHLGTLRDVLRGRREIGSVTGIVRSPERATPAPGLTRLVRSGSDEARAATAAAGLVICATTARTPLFDGRLVRDDAVVIAVGSHEPDARELDAALIGRSDVVVEDRGTALRECGDVVLAVEEGAIAPEDLLPMADVVTGRSPLRGDRPVVFKSSGMPWEDLVIAGAIARAHAR